MPTSLPPSAPRHAGDPTDPELRRNPLGRPPLEHPAARQHRAERPSGGAAPLSVMEWLVAVGHAVARRVRRAPQSAMVPLHPPR